MDIDIDIRKDTKIFELFKNLVPASRVENNELKSHAAGAYFQNMARDPTNNLAAIPYKEAEELGYFKIDFLHVNALDDFTSNQELRELAEKEPNWTLLEHKYIVSKLFHIADHFDVVYLVKPTSLLEISDILALIRPNKRKLLDKYLENKQAMRKELYTRRDKTDMRKSHTIPYAQIIVAQLNLIELGRL